MAAVILNPGSISNPSSNYRVVEFDAWRANENDPSRIPVLAEFADLGNAEVERDIRNAAL